MLKKFFLFLWEVAKISIIALIIVVPIRVFIFQPFFVRGPSMEPNFHNFDYLIVDELSYRFSGPHRGDVVVFYNPQNTKQRFIKRVIGLPGETVEIKDGKVMIKKDGQLFTLNEDYIPKNFKTSGNLIVSVKKDEYFVLGDNRAVSYDSRFFGPIKRNYIIGKVAFQVWPISVFAKD